MTTGGRSQRRSEALDPAAPAVLFITRKYPPARGGMEQFSFHLYERYRGPKRLSALRRGQRWLPVFVLGAFVAAMRHGRRVSVLHLGDALLTPLAPALRRISGAAVVATVHGQDVTRKLRVYQWVLGRSIPALKTGLIAVSEYTAGEILARHGVRPHVIPNGVDAHRFNSTPAPESITGLREQLGLPSAGPLILSVGRLVPRKGICWFVERVMPLLPPDIALVVVGDGPDGRRLAALARADPRVMRLGEVPDVVADRLYQVADLFVAPNVPVDGSPEGFGIAPAEAAAAGVRVLASDLEGLRDMASLFGATLVPPGDASAWAAAVAGALRGPGPIAIPVRGWDEVASDYERFFRSVAPARAMVPNPASAGRPTPR